MAQDDLTALLARLHDLPAGTMLTVLIPRGQIAAVAGLLVQENETFRIPAAVLAAPALDAPPPVAAPDPDTPRSVTALRDLNARAAPVMTAELRGVVAAGTSVLAFAETQGAYRRVVFDGATAWVLSSGLNGA